MKPTFGGGGRPAETEGWSRRAVGGVVRDGRQALRRLLADFPFSAGAIAILALGIGANTAVFSLLNNTLFQPHPFQDSRRLVNVYQNDAKAGEPEGMSYAAFLDLQKETRVFQAVAAGHLSEGRYQVEEAHGQPGAVHSSLVEYSTANQLDVLGMRPSLGRWFTADEERRDDRVVVLGWDTWNRDFRADPNVLGRTLIVAGKPVRVIGVGPKTLHSSQSNAIFVSLWMPIRHTDRPGDPGSGAGALEKRENLFLQVRARLRDGVTIQQAQAAMSVVSQRFAADFPDTDPKRGITVLATDDVHVHPREKFLKPVAVIIFSVVGLVLAIACSNLATLLLVRSSSRSKELSVRMALGATRGQLVRHLLMESLVLSLAGAAVGVALAHWGLRYLGTVDLHVMVTMQLDYRVLGFAVAAATLCSLGFGLTPALQATRLDVAGKLREEKGSSGSSLSLSRGWFTMKNVLVTGQVAASFLLLVGAVLALNVLRATQERSLGFRPEGLAFIEMDPRWAGYDAARAESVLEQLRQRIAGLPGVMSASVTIGWPVDGQFENDFSVDGMKAGETVRVEGRWAGPGYFQTVGTPLLFGRVFNEGDLPQSPEVIVVSEAFARRLFGMPNAVGKRVRLADAGNKPVGIIGVVGNTRSIDMVADAPKKTFYRSAAQAGIMPTTVVVRASRNDGEFVGLLQQEVRRLHPELPVTTAMTMKQRQEKELVLFRAAVISLGTLGTLGLLLAAVGLYAVVSYAVAQRTSELGIRIALGARPGDLTWLVVRDVTALVVVGIAIGSALSWTGVTVLESSAAQIMGIDPFAVAPVALIILVCAAAAAYRPARRAVETDPIAAIRHQ